MRNKARNLVVGAVTAFHCASLGHGSTITFAPGNYDNTANTVTGTNAAPVYNNNQTTGAFRDVFWWGTAYNGGTKGVGSPDFINSGKNLISNGGTPARAVVGGLYDALNFTGLRTSGGASFLSIYDTTPLDGTATRNLFNATGGLQVSADVLITPGTHVSAGGVVTMYNEGQDGLALLVQNNTSGSNHDFSKVSLVFQQSGALTNLASVDLANGTFSPGIWTRVILDVSVSGDAWTANGHFFSHSTPTDPTSALGSEVAGSALTFSGSLSSPGNALDLTNPGEIGLMAWTPENFNDGVDTVHGGTGANPLVDNIGVSITNFTFPGPSFGAAVPAPSAILGGLAGLGALVARKMLRKAR